MARERQRRGYSRAFRPQAGTGKAYLLAQVPAGLWAAVTTKARRQGISMRALILELLSAWLTGAITLERDASTDAAGVGR